MFHKKKKLAADDDILSAVTVLKPESLRHSDKNSVSLKSLQTLPIDNELIFQLFVSIFFQPVIIYRGRKATDKTTTAQTIC